MPSISTTFIDLLMYMAPGLVLLYSFRVYFPAIDKLIGSSGEPPLSLEALISLLLMTIPAGVVVKAISQILVRVLAFFGRHWNRPREERTAVYRNILTQDADKLNLFDSYIRSMQTNAAMATAFVIFLVSMVWHHLWGDHSMSGSRFVLVSAVAVALLVATVLSLGTLHDVMEAFSPGQKQKTDGHAAA